MRKKNLNLIIISVALGVLSYLSLLSPFFLQNQTPTTSGASASITKIFSFSDWQNILKIQSQTLWCWKLANVLMIISFVLITAIIVISIVKYFVKNDVLLKIHKGISIAEIVIASAFLLFFIIGCLMQFATTTSYHLLVFPHVGPALLGLSSLASAIISLKTK